MSIDKFGRMRGSAKQAATTSGVTLSQANNLFLKRDGTSVMGADLNMNGNSIKGLPTTYPIPEGHGDEAVSWFQVASLVGDSSGNVSRVTDPTSDNHMTNKKYVDDLIRQHIVMTATPTMTSNETVINGLTYVASASGHLVESDNRVYKPWQAFQNDVSNGWMCDNQGDNIWIQMKYPFPMSMSGFHILVADIGLEDTDIMITNWKVQASNDGITFTDIVSFPLVAPSFTTGDLKKFTFQASARYAYWRFCILSSNSNSGQTGIEMLQWIPTLPGRQLTKCHVGYIPRLTANTNNYCGFEASASSEMPDKKAFNAFKGINGVAWAASEITPNLFLEIQCPTPVRIWKVGVKGRASETINDWKIEGKRGLGSWVVLWISKSTIPHRTITEKYLEFDVDSVCKFDAYRLTRLRTNSSKVGISAMQLFVYND